MNNQIKWLCHHAVNEGLLTYEQCQLIMDAFEEQGVEEDLAVFVKTAIDNDLCAEASRLEGLARLAESEALVLGQPPSPESPDHPEAPCEYRHSEETDDYSERDTREFPMADEASQESHCLVSEPGETAQRTCPFCAEPIQMAAIRCKHCGADVETEKRLTCHECRRELVISKAHYESALRTHTLFSCPHCKASFVLKGSPAKGKGSSDPLRRAVTIGYVMAFLVPLIGAVLSVYLLVKGKVGHFALLLFLSLFMSYFWFGFFLSL
jgi:hypothetical protein